MCSSAVESLRAVTVTGEIKQLELTVPALAVSPLRLRVEYLPVTRGGRGCQCVPVDWNGGLKPETEGAALSPQLSIRIFPPDSRKPATWQWQVAASGAGGPPGPGARPAAAGTGILHIPGTVTLTVTRSTAGRCCSLPALRGAASIVREATLTERIYTEGGVVALCSFIY